jgi:hypothetical protein
VSGRKSASSGRSFATISEKKLWNSSNFYRPPGCYSLSIGTMGSPYLSIYHPNSQVVLFFLSFPTTPILSQSDTRAKSYDKNIKTCAESFLETWKVSGPCCPSVGTVAVSRSMSKHEIRLRVEIGEAWPSVWTVLPWRPDVFDAEASRHCRASGRLQRPVRTIAQEPAILTWKLHGIFMDIFLETCDL